MSCSLFSIIHCFFSSLLSIILSLLFALFHNTLSARSSNQLRTSGSFLSLTIMFCMSQFRLFLFFSQIIILPYILPLVIELFDFINFHLHLHLIIFIMTVIIIIILMIIIINIIILCYSSKHAERCKIWICDPLYYKKEFLISDFKCWNTFRCNGYWDTIK